MEQLKAKLDLDRAELKFQICHRLAVALDNSLHSPCCRAPNWFQACLHTGSFRPEPTASCLEKHRPLTPRCLKYCHIFTCQDRKDKLLIHHFGTVTFTKNSWYGPRVVLSVLCGFIQSTTLWNGHYANGLRFTTAEHELGKSTHSHTKRPLSAACLAPPETSWPNGGKFTKFSVF